MTEKSYVSMERRICIVCGVQYDTNVLIIDRRLRNTLNMHTTTGWGLCSAHAQLFNDGLLALVEIDLEMSGNPPEGSGIQPEKAYRTGTIAHLSRDAVAQVFKAAVPRSLPCVFVPVGEIQKLQVLLQPSSSDLGSA
jgi:hypothetical protein